ncbi:helix-turn-helix domain-containing protein [Corynebacterium mendelii]|uniref:Helix-turn-helix domain-containing protein n=1 Tax=Corynebacterium mendelii TaxID=2765362 RepID=A0A939DYM2_9CORY|nr:helix-turn-helix domain-containing protein [Corynebacterium mendelii]MBN9643214.1 helix-turn-helix domain-containing protein [Corynebacterium mendelii]
MTATKGQISDAMGLRDFRAAVAESFVPLQVSCDDESTFAGRIEHQEFGRTGFNVVEVTPHRVIRTRELIARSGAGHIKIALQIEGHGVLHQDGRTVRIKPGDITIYDTSRPYTLDFTTHTRLFVMMVSRSDCGIPLTVLDGLTAQPLAGSAGVATSVSAFLSGLADHFDELSSSCGQRLAGTALDLVRPILLAAAEHHGVGQGGKAQLLSEIDRFIDEHVADPDLDPALIAAAHFISVRQLHSIFRDSGKTVCATIKHKRLAKAKRMLTQPAYDHMSIGAVASACGMTDAAYFSRAFRGVYAMTPKQARADRG